MIGEARLEKDLPGSDVGLAEVQTAVELTMMRSVSAKNSVEVTDPPAESRFLACWCDEADRMVAVRLARVEQAWVGLDDFLVLANAAASLASEVAALEACFLKEPRASVWPEAAPALKKSASTTDDGNASVPLTVARTFPFSTIEHLALTAGLL